MTSREMPKNRKIMVVDEDTHTSLETVVEFLSGAVEINKFLHFNEPPKRIFCYIIRLFDAKPSQIGHNFT